MFKINILLALLRASALVGALIIIDALSELGTSVLALACTILISVFIATRLSYSNIRTQAILAAALLYWLLQLGFLKLLELLPFAAERSLDPFLFGLHLELISIVFLGALLSTVLVQRYILCVTIELFALLSVTVYLVSAHRNYQLDSPQALNSVAWFFGRSPQSILIIFAGSAVLATICYAVLSSWSARVIQISKLPALDNQPSTKRSLASSLALFSLLLTVALSGLIINRSYNVENGILSNGVGQSNKEGTSPLNPNSSMGRSNEPTALVRLEGDYKQNPFSPMLYLREAAQSKLQGNMYVVAAPTFDADVSNSDPRSPYTGQIDPDISSIDAAQSNHRVEVVQSIYLLSDQNVAFAIDYPTKIRQLINPDPNRFKMAFRAYSLAPTFKLQELSGLQVGDPRWTQEVKKHYLEVHSDPRYNIKALDITSGINDPISKAFAITKSLSKNSIYTLKPNHDFKPDEDPIAPYLFGDMRGYCVHFSTAIVHMLRSLGIPARVATGYLTDLSEAKDGHILLRMSDRHAWAEAYISKRGWVPFDIQPEQVESAIDVPVDMGILEELMNKLEPGEEILPKELIDDESVFEPEKWIPEIHPAHLALFVVTVLTILILFKLYLLYGYRLARTPVAKLKAAYRSLLSEILDLGLDRLDSETRTEHAFRSESRLGLKMQLLAEPLSQAIYGSRDPKNISDINIEELRFKARSELNTISPWRRILAFFNPRSILALIKRRW